MSPPKDEYEIDNIVNSEATGESEKVQNFKSIIYPIGKYEVTVRLSAEGQFIAIDEVKINKSFINYRKLSTSGDYHDVDEFYKEKK